VLDQAQQKGNAPRTSASRQSSRRDSHITGLDKTDVVAPMLSALDGALARTVTGLLAMTQGLGTRTGNNARARAGGANRVSPDVAVPLFGLMERLPTLPPATAILGLADDGRPIVLTLGEDGMDHVLITGDDGAGKSTLLRTMLLSLVANNRQSALQIVVFDGSAGSDRVTAAEWRPLGTLPHALAPVVFEADESAEGLAFLAEEMVYRLAQNHRQPRIVVAVDDLDILLSGHGEELLEALSGLASSGARAGIHVLATATAPELLDNLLRVDFDLRLAGRTADPSRAYLATGLSDGELRHLLGQGDFVVRDGDAITRFQAASATQEQVGRWLRGMRPWHAGTLLAGRESSRTVLDAEPIDGSSSFEETGR